MVAMTTASQSAVLPTERSTHQVDIRLGEGGASGDGAQSISTATTGRAMVHRASAQLQQAGCGMTGWGGGGE